MSPRKGQTSATQRVQKLLRRSGFQISINRQLDNRGRAFQAWDREAKLNRCVRLLPADETAEQRLRSLRRVDAHDQIVPGIIAVRRVDTELILVTKWIEGQSLRQYLKATTAGRTNGISLHQSLYLYRSLVHGLSALHRFGFVVHGDIKPENLVVTRGQTWRLKLIDFGSSWQSEANRYRKEADGISAVYAAPECQPGRDASPNYLSDQFSASVVLFEMLTGEVPYDRLGGMVDDGMTLEKASDMLIDKTPYPQRVLDAVDELLRTGLAIDPEKRFSKRRAWQNAVDGCVQELQREIPSARTWRDWFGI